jgi:hypothetical protein
MVGLNAHAIALGYALGAALLGLWLFQRCPSRGPGTVKAAFILVACAYPLLLVTGPLTGAADALAGPAVALLLVYLPILTFTFWAAAHLLRATIGAVSRTGL